MIKGYSNNQGSKEIVEAYVLVLFSMQVVFTRNLLQGTKARREERREHGSACFSLGHGKTWYV